MTAYILYFPMSMLQHVVADCGFVGTSSCQAFVAYQATYSFELYPVTELLSSFQLGMWPRLVYETTAPAQGNAAIWSMRS